MTTVTVGIKALNEERHIEASVRSALAAVAPFGGNVILGDSGSTDRTIEIAQRFPIRIVQFRNPLERSCGSGAQLAYQYATGDYFYLLDGDMTLEADFIEAGLAYLEAHPRVAGVGGHVVEVNTVAHEFQIRKNAQEANGHWKPGVVDRLDCGGLYRTAAVLDAGYFADRNLHSFEEFELGARLKSRGWELARIDHPAVKHHGHVAGGYRLLWRRFTSGYAGSAGEVLRGAIGQPHLGVVLERLGHIRNTLIVFLWWVLLALAAIVPGARLALIPLLVLPVLYLAGRRRSLRLGLFSFASWNIGALGFIGGFLRRRLPPGEPIETIDLSPSTLASRPAAAPPRPGDGFAIQAEIGYANRL